MRQAYDITVSWIHFPLHPDTPAGGISLEEMFKGRNFDLPALKAQMRELMEAEGLPYGDRDMTYNSRLAQELGKWADTQPGGEGIHDALFRAYFVDGINLSDVDALVKIAEAVGVSGELGREVLEQRQYKAVVDSDWRRSGMAGVRGVPTFVANKLALVGWQPYEHLERFVQAAGAQPRTP